MTTLWMVTVKTPKTEDHDFRHKQVGDCVTSSLTCTDKTGQHHTKLVEADTRDECGVKIVDWWEDRFAGFFGPLHITRIERVDFIL